MTARLVAAILIKFFAVLSNHSDPLLKRAAGEARKELLNAQKVTSL